MKKSITLQFVNKFDKMAHSMREFLNFAKKNKRILKKDFDIDNMIFVSEQFKKEFIDLH